jgi:putative heme-binding domain-containing protein
MTAIVAVSVTVLVAVGTMESGQSAAAGSAPPITQRRSTEWTMDALLPSLVDLGSGHVFEKGQALFKQGLCGGCHAFASESKGSGFAPDLTAVASKFSRDAILQSILEPSAELTPNYQQTKFTLKDGRVITATVVERNDKRIVLAPALLAVRATIDINTADVASEETSPVSAMPAGLLNSFTKEEVVELMAFLESGGDRTAPFYKKK